MNKHYVESLPIYLFIFAYLICYLIKGAKAARARKRFLPPSADNQTQNFAVNKPPSLNIKTKASMTPFQVFLLSTWNR